MVFDKMKCRQDGYPAFPEIGGASQPVERLALACKQIGADDVFGRTVDQIPIVDIARVA